MMMSVKEVILQKGEVVCSICENRFSWSYAFSLLHGTEWESRWGKITTGVKDTPSNHVSFFTNSEKKVVFNIMCPKCNTVHQTKPMDMVSSEK